MRIWSRAPIRVTIVGRARARASHVETGTLTMDTEVAKEKQIPLVLTFIGLVIWVIVGMSKFGVGPGTMILIVAIDASVRTVLLVGAAFVTAQMLGVSFGDLGAAWLKFAAVVVLPGAIGAAIPFGGIVGMVIAFGLLLWLFDLEVYQAAVFAIIYFVVSIVAALILAGVIANLR
jgi:hypothetical protein